jgi:DNA-binding transcriptional ArsR family regulator
VVKQTVNANAFTLAKLPSKVKVAGGQNTLDYYAVLAEVGAGKWSPKRDARSWIRFCLTAHHMQATTVLRRSKEMQRLWDAIELEVSKRRLLERAIPALVDAAVRFRIRNATYRVVTDVSETVAGRDLKSLVDAGLIVPKGDKRSRFYTASEALRRIREQTREPRFRLVDPFREEPPRRKLLAPGLGI